MSASESHSERKDSELENSELSLANNFKKVYSALLDRFLRNFKLKEFKDKYYPEVYKNDPGFLKDVYHQFLSQVKDGINRDIETLCDEHQLFMKIDEMENLNKEAKVAEGNGAWRPSEDPNEDIRDHKMKYKVAHKKQLESYLENLKSQNEQAEEKIMAEHEEIMALKEKIDKQSKENSEDWKALESVDFQKIESVGQMMDFD